MSLRLGAVMIAKRGLVLGVLLAALVSACGDQAEVITPIPVPSDTPVPTQAPTYGPVVTPSPSAPDWIVQQQTALTAAAALDVVELAAWTNLARVILNLHETITRN